MQFSEMQDFAAKQNALFASLDEASRELKGTGLDQSGRSSDAVDALRRSSTSYRLAVSSGGVNRSMRITSDHSLSRMRGKESIFKKPALPIGKCLKPRKVPDYQVNPHRWKKYSLEDVDISDHTNTAAAFEFLKQIDDQREVAANSLLGDESASAEKKIEFKKSSKLRRNLTAIEADEVVDCEVDKPQLRGSKVMMPEYVVGHKKVPKKKLAPKGHRAAGTLTLAHLREDDEEVDE